MSNKKTSDKVSTFVGVVILFIIGMAISAPVTLVIAGLALIGKIIGDREKRKDKKDLEDIKQALKRMQR